MTVMRLKDWMRGLGGVASSLYTVLHLNQLEPAAVWGELSCAGQSHDGVVVAGAIVVAVAWLGPWLC